MMLSNQAVIGGGSYSIAMIIIYTVSVNLNPLERKNRFLVENRDNPLGIKAPTPYRARIRTHQNHPVLL